MKNFIKKMQTKSEAEKRYFAFWVASGLTLFIFGIWFLNLLATFNSTGAKNIENQANIVSSFWTDLKDNIFNKTEVYQAPQNP